VCGNAPFGYATRQHTLYFFLYTQNRNYPDAAPSGQNSVNIRGANSKKTCLPARLVGRLQNNQPDAARAKHCCQVGLDGVLGEKRIRKSILHELA
jgi:hypothetical protein